MNVLLEPSDYHPSKNSQFNKYYLFVNQTTIQTSPPQILKNIFLKLLLDPKFYNHFKAHFSSGE